MILRNLETSPFKMIDSKTFVVLLPPILSRYCAFCSHANDVTGSRNDERPTSFRLKPFYPEIRSSVEYI